MLRSLASSRLLLRSLCLKFPGFELPMQKTDRLVHIGLKLRRARARVLPISLRAPIAVRRTGAG